MGFNRLVFVLVLIVPAFARVISSSKNSVSGCQQGPLESSLLAWYDPANTQVVAIAKNGTTHNVTLPYLRSACATSKYIFFVPDSNSNFYSTNCIYKTSYVLDSYGNLKFVSSEVTQFHIFFDGEIIGEGLACSDQFVYLTSDGRDFDFYGRVYQFRTNGPSDQKPVVVVQAYKSQFLSLSLTPNQAELMATVDSYGYFYDNNKNNMAVIRVANNTYFTFCSSKDQPDPAGLVVTNAQSIVFSQSGSEYLCYLNKTLGTVDNNKCGLCDTSADMPRAVLAASVQAGSSTVYNKVAQLGLLDTFYSVTTELPLPFGDSASNGWDGILAIPGSSC